MRTRNEPSSAWKSKMNGCGRGADSVSSLRARRASSRVRPPCDDALDHLAHLFLAGLARDLQQQRLRDDSLLDAGVAHVVGNHAQRHRFGDGRTRAADFLGDVVVRVIEMIGQALQAVGFFEGRQVLALEVFDQREFESFGVVRDFLDAGQFVQAGGLRGVVAALAGDDVVGVLARHVAHQQRLEHALFADGIGQLADVADILARLIRVRPNLVDRDHAPDGRAAEAGQRLDVMRVMPHLESDGQPDPLRHVVYTSWASFLYSSAPEDFGAKVKMVSL